MSLTNELQAEDKNTFIHSFSKSVTKHGHVIDKQLENGLFDEYLSKQQVNSVATGTNN